MPTLPPSSIIQDLQDYFQCCERLLARAQESNHLFSQDEMKKMCYLSNQVAKLSDYRKHGMAISPRHQDPRRK